jgi:hypothetical protein
VVGLLIGEAVSILKKHIVAKDVVGLLLGEVASAKKKEKLFIYLALAKPALPG